MSKLSLKIQYINKYKIGVAYIHFDFVKVALRGEKGQESSVVIVIQLYY